MNNISSWPSLFQYLFKPEYRELDSSLSLKKTILLCLGYYLVMQVVNFSQISLLSPVAELIEDKNTNMYQSIEALRETPLLLFFYFAILAPFVEELWFRFGLKKYNWNIMAIWSLLMIPIIFIFFFDISQFDPIAAFSISLFFGLFLYFITKKENMRETFWPRHFFWLFWGTSLIFGIAHYSNFLGADFSMTMAYILLIYTLSRGLLGAILAYIRMRFGFGYAVFVHGLNNAIPAIAIIALSDEEWQKAMGLIF